MTITGYIITIGSVCTAFAAIGRMLRTTGGYAKKKANECVDERVQPMFKEIKDDLLIIKTDISDLRDDNDRIEMQTLRYNCLCFASDLRKGIMKTRQEYEEIFRMETRYNDLIEQHNISNGYMHEEMLYVHEQYRKLK